MLKAENGTMWKGSYISNFLVIWFTSLGQVEDYGTIISSYSPHLGLVKCLLASTHISLDVFCRYGLCFSLVLMLGEKMDIDNVFDILVFNISLRGSCYISW